MKTVTESVVLPCTVEAFWRVFLDETYMRTLFMDELKFKELTILELTDSTRKIRATPKVNLPSLLEKLIGDSFAYEEHGTLDRGKSEWTWRMLPPVAVDGKGKAKKEFVSTRGTIRVSAEGDAQCRRTDTVQVEAKVFGVGGLIESTVEKELHSAWTREFAFLRSWLAKKVG